MSSDGTTLAVAGIGNSQPLLMDINPINGTLNKFISLDFVYGTQNSQSVYESFGAIYYDKQDYRDYSPYFYTAFIKDDEVFYLRV